MLFYPLDGQYVVFPGSIYATYLIDADCPNPCRKYHISSAVTCGHAVANIVLPILRETNTHHKIVRDWQSLLRQTDGDFADQAGKFITVYMRPGVGFRNALLQAINVELQNARGTMPCPKQPTLRLGRGGPEDTRIYETPVFSGPKGCLLYTSRRVRRFGHGRRNPAIAARHRRQHRRRADRAGRLHRRPAERGTPEDVYKRQPSRRFHRAATTCPARAAAALRLRAPLASAAAGCPRIPDTPRPGCPAVLCRCGRSPSR